MVSCAVYKPRLLINYMKLTYGHYIISLVKLIFNSEVFPLRVLKILFATSKTNKQTFHNLLCNWILDVSWLGVLRDEEFLIFALTTHLGSCFDRIKCLINASWMKISIEHSSYGMLYLVQKIKAKDDMVPALVSARRGSHSGLFSTPPYLWMPNFINARYSHFCQD